MEREERDFDESFIKCYEAFGERLFRYVCRIVRDEDSARELVQDLFLRIYEKRITLDAESEGIKFLLYRMLRNLAYDHLRKKIRQAAGFDDIVIQEVCLNEQFYRDVESIYIEGEVISTLKDSIQELPEKSREVITKRCLEEMSLAVVVRETSISKYHISRLEREAYRLLRTEMEKRIDGWRVRTRRPFTREWKK